MLVFHIPLNTYALYMGACNTKRSIWMHLFKHCEVLCIEDNEYADE